jgi:hypothetical protein
MTLIMPQLTIPQGVAALLPLISTMLSGWLAQDRLPRWANALIALVALVGTAILCLVLAGNFTGNAQASVLAVLGYVALLMAGDLHTLYQFLVAVPSPLAAALVEGTPPDPQATQPRRIVSPPRPVKPPPASGGTATGG